MTENRSTLLSLIAESENCVVFTGAGVSTESGIPDFRSPGGLWTNNMPIYFDDFVNSQDMRREAWRRKFAMEDHFAQARPNEGHKAIAHLVRTGRASHVITQNIDNLHQESGVPDEKIIELHGNGSFAHCLDCGRRYELDWVRDLFEGSGDPPDCPACGGLVKTATVSFGQSMPEAAMERARVASLTCDLFIAAGSSLVVFPAAGFPIIAKQNGARLVIVNREPTEMDDLADLVVNDEIGKVFAPLTGLN